jgi:uncharacterized protein YkwD
MHRRSVLAAGAATLAGCSSLADEPDAGVAEAAIRDRVNAQREAADRAPLVPSETLQTAAVEHSRDMAERDFYAHENPDGQQPWDRVPCQAGETIHRGVLGKMQNEGSAKLWRTDQSDDLAGYVAEGWRLSEDHYEIITKRKWTAIGVGVAIKGDEFFATAMFC